MLNTSLLDRFLGKKVRFYREKMKWPLKSLAMELGVSIQQLQRYEQGDNKISASTLYEMARILKMPLSAFFENFVPQEPEGQKPAFNVLMIEDNAHDEFLLRKALQDFSDKICIYCLRDGDEATGFLRMLSLHEPTPFPQPNIILLDLNLGHMKGLDILKDIKRKPVLQDIPVIVMTNSLDPQDMEASYHLNASGFIRKSFSYEAFKEQIHKIFAYWMEAVTLPPAAA